MRCVDGSAGGRQASIEGCVGGQVAARKGGKAGGHSTGLHVGRTAVDHQSSGNQVGRDQRAADDIGITRETTGSLDIRGAPIDFQGGGEGGVGAEGAIVQEQVCGLKENTQ